MVVNSLQFPDDGNAAYRPRPEDFERALRIRAAYERASAAQGGAVGAIVVDDEMVDEAGVKLAAAIVARGRAAGLRGLP